MTALAAGKTQITPSIWLRKSFTLTSGQIAYHGGLAALVNGTGKIVTATASTPLIIGKFVEDVNASSTGLNADSPVTVEFPEEKRLTPLVNGTSGDAIAAANIGQTVYALDDQTATIVPNASPLGTFYGFDAQLRVLVHLGHFLVSSGTAVTTVGTAPAYVSNELIITSALAVSGAVFDIPSTGAASLVTLAVTGVADGTTLTFIADGTKNGHTVQYRYGTTNITTALTASKIHRVSVTKLNSMWGATAYVSP